MTELSNSRGLIIAAPKSGSGKTLITLALLRAIRNRDIKVASAKIGPDYIDPAFHRAASGHNCLNIDPWAMRPETRRNILDQLAENNPEIIITEGVMGLFDGAKDGTGSTADFAAEIGLPVLLVVDVKGQSASAIATIKGFIDLRDDVQIGGVLFNNLGSLSHKDLIQQAMDKYLPDLPILGYLPRHPDLEMPERHLGLVQAGEHSDLEGFLQIAANWISEYCDIDKLISISSSLQYRNDEGVADYIPPIGKHIAVARDLAYAFCYEGMLTHWRKMGAEISFFSPLLDEVPNEEADAVYLPGGYPELHAAKLAANENFLNGLRKAAKQEKFIFGECGGYMTLGRQIVDKEGVAHDMAGLLPVITNFQKRKLHLGYRKAELQHDCPLGKAGDVYLAHEFHYASTDEIDMSAETLFSTKDATNTPMGTVGLRVGSVMGSFIHLIDRMKP
ncbi:cobyrinate a,c-diamide synthase [Curvivirga sp.]|uniref:cobyrinate a,c-diamide synthase n=1 Tax=Curvivirga sp. TaxID=2856848 RepID=UPI003B5A3AD8